jgi:hypothetical protein
MTLITLQDGKAVLREGKVGTEQACCCGEGCPASEAAGASVQLPLDAENLQQRTDDALDAFIQYLTGKGYFQALTDAGYTNVTSSKESFVTGEFLLTNLSITAECCPDGNIDFEAEPVWDDFDLQPGDIPDLASAIAGAIYPCNPLP